MDPLAAAPFAPAAAPLSPLALLLAADPVVQAVMALLILASIVCWALAFETARRQGALRRALRRAAEGGLVAQPTLARPLLAAARETAALDIPRETGGERRARIERAMREAAAAVLRGTDAGLSTLATIAAVAPFVGLFGTVWGVMNAFSAIAGTNDISLATVAPGIAEALFTTATGLFCAIPAVIAYNRLGTAAGRLGGAAEALVRREAEAIAAVCPPADGQGAIPPFRAAAE